MLARIKTGYTNGGRGLGMALMARFRSLPFTPNQVTVAGLLGDSLSPTLDNLLGAGATTAILRTVVGQVDYLTDALNNGLNNLVGDHGIVSGLTDALGLGGVTDQLLGNDGVVGGLLDNLLGNGSVVSGLLAEDGGVGGLLGPDGVGGGFL